MAPGCAAGLVGGGGSLGRRICRGLFRTVAVIERELPEEYSRALSLSVAFIDTLGMVWQIANMPRQTMNVSLPKAQEQFVRSQVG